MRIRIEQLIVEHEPADLTDLDMLELRSWRERLQSVEYGYSYARRVTQGRLDTLIGELERRRNGTGGSVLDTMPATLGSNIAGSGLPRPTRDLEPPDWAHDLVAELDEIVGPETLGSLDEIDVDVLADLAQAVSTFEHDLSDARATLHERIDRVQAELISRYRDGAAVDDLLG